jgi:SAM-dependent methyltransferase
MQVLQCYNCGSGRHSYYDSENGFTLVKCQECGLLYVNPRPEDDDILRAHQQGVHGGLQAFDVTGSFDRDKVKRHKKILKDFFGNGESLQGKTWLDIGCGHGEFLVALREFGRESILAKGTEPNVHKKILARKMGLDVDYFDLNTHEGKYDVISFLNVYSHLPDPPDSILAWSRLLKPQGEFLIETGDTAEFKSKDHPKPLYLPDHLSFASEKIVVRILNRSGFEITAIRKYPFIQLTARTFIKELIKALLPNRTSRLKLIVQGKRYSEADMFIRARLKS